VVILTTYNITSVLGTGSHEINAVHLDYCLPTMQPCRLIWKNSVFWNNCFCHIFRCCWRESLRSFFL